MSEVPPEILEAFALILYADSKVHLFRLLGIVILFVWFESSSVPALVSAVSSSRKPSEVLVRIAAAAALLICSVCGKTLHLLQHTLADAIEFNSPECETHADHHGCCRRHSCDFGVHGRTVKEIPGRSDSRHSHDSHNCSICYAIWLPATPPEITTAAAYVQLNPLGRLIVPNESVASDGESACDARGPPSLS